MFARTPDRIAGVLLVLLLLAPRDSAAQWRLDGAPLCTAPSNQLTPVTIPDGAGGAIVTWYDYRSGSPDIYVQRVLATGAADPGWPDGGRALCAASQGQYSPTLVGDGAGGAIVVWHDDRASSTDIYAARVLASGAPDPAWPTDGRGVCTASGDQIYPDVASDGSGGALVTWRDDRGGPDTDIYAQRVLSSGAVDPAWPPNGRALCTAAGNQSVPRIAPDGSGGAFIVWSDLRGAHSDIYAQRVLASGAVDAAWPADGLAVCGAIGNQSGPSIVTDGAGGAIATWFDYRNGLDSDIYAQHVLASGLVDPAWPAGGRALCTAPGEQYSPVAVSDGVGGAVVTWYDYRDDPEAADIYAVRVLPSGAVDPAWPSDGRALCIASGDQPTPAVAPDGSGGALVAWLDYRDGAFSDIYAQHAPASGAANPGWPADGLAVCEAPNLQLSPTLASDGLGGAILAWMDFRGGVYADIYVHRILAGGAVAAVGPDAPAGPGPLAIRPNPVHGRATIELELPDRRRVDVEVLDPAGRRVRTLVSGAILPAGRHALDWDGADDAGTLRANGVYWVRAVVSGRALARRLVLLR